METMKLKKKKIKKCEIYYGLKSEEDQSRRNNKRVKTIVESPQESWKKKEKKR